MEKIVIIGGGIAGLSCLNALLDKGIPAILFEGATIGTPKMCGEFLAPEAVNLLEKWQIGPIQSIKKAVFFALSKSFQLNFPIAAGACSRSEIEVQLADRARKNGGKIFENYIVKSIIPATKHSPHQFTFATGETIESITAIFATGKLGQHVTSPPNFPYMGFKIHFQQVVTLDTLLMHSLPGAYFGIVPISSDRSNCACLVRREIIASIGSCKQFFYELIENHPLLKSTFKHIDISQSTFLESPAPEFGFKSVPLWPNALWIGDALASFHPAIGYGFAHSVNSAVIAAEYYANNNLNNYHQSSTQIIKRKIWLGKLIHRVLLNPLTGFLMLPLLQRNSWIAKYFLRILSSK